MVVFETAIEKSPHFLEALGEPEKLSYQMSDELEAATKSEVDIGGWCYTRMVATEQG